MPLQYTPSKHAFHTKGPSLTEPEHADSCDINKMIRDVHRGIQVRGGRPFQYGYDDTTLDGVQHRIQKQQLEDELSHIAKTQEFTEEELKHFPKDVKEKFKLRKKQSKNDDDKTTTKQNAQTQNSSNLNKNDSSSESAGAGASKSSGGTPPHGS